MDLAQEPGQLDGEGSAKVGVETLKLCVTGIAHELRVGSSRMEGIGVAGKLFGIRCLWVQAMQEKTAGLLEPLARGGRIKVTR